MWRTSTRRKKKYMNTGTERLWLLYINNAYIKIYQQQKILGGTIWVHGRCYARQGAVRNWSRSWACDNSKKWTQKVCGHKWFMSVDTNDVDIIWTLSLGHGFDLFCLQHLKFLCVQTVISALSCQPDEADTEAGMCVFYVDRSFVGSTHPHSWVSWKLPLKFLLFSALTTMFSLGQLTQCSASTLNSQAIEKYKVSVEF